MLEIMGLFDNSFWKQFGKQFLRIVFENYFMIFYKTKICLEI